MFDIVGKHNKARIYAELLDSESYSQIQNLVNQEFVKDSKICMMPDAHAGAGCTIGTTMTIRDMVVPNLVGVDIGCSVTAVKLTEKISSDNIELFKRLDQVIEEHIPVGFNVRDARQMETKTVFGGSIASVADYLLIETLHCKDHVNIQRGKQSFGTLGGGNHFIELANGVDSTYLIIHSGSRKLGMEVAEYYQGLAVRNMKKYSDSDLKEIIEKHKLLGTTDQIPSAIAEHKKTFVKVPDDFAYLTGNDLQNYLDDVHIMQSFVMKSHLVMADLIVRNLRIDADSIFTTMHNYIDHERMILRKGAVSANAGEQLIIPMNMRDGSLICTGKGNPDWNYSAPHGAGRLMSRGQARRNIALDDFKESMSGIYSSTVNNSTIDEAPMAYKPIDTILNAIEDTVEIIEIIKPIYNLKASE